jgi:hypothetical protein
MSIFGSIRDAIFGGPAAAAEAPAPSSKTDAVIQPKATAAATGSVQPVTASTRKTSTGADRLLT